MGCDIHLIIEQKIDGNWKLVPSGKKWGWDKDYNEVVFDSNSPVPPEIVSGVRDKDWYDGRNYDLFGILAGVRNCNVTPISYPKGLPDDMDDTTMKGYLGDHSFSWLTLKELLDYNYDTPSYTTIGCVEEKEYQRWKESGDVLPKSWCGAACGYSVRTFHEAEYLTKRGTLPKELTNEEVDVVRKEFPKIPGEINKTILYYIYCEWSQTPREMIDKSWWNMVERLKELDADFENVRLVFGFDS